MLNRVDIGEYDLGRCIVILDETSIEYNSRKFKTNFTDNAMYWWRMARHYEAAEIYLYSQSFDDMDLTLRRLAYDYYVVTRSRIPFFHFVKIRRVLRQVGVDDTDHQFKDLYEYAPFWCTRRIYARRYWHMFDSYECKYLPPYDRRLWYPDSPAPPRRTFFSKPKPSAEPRANE